ncbi:MAG: TIGR01620 family protein [Beggiatoa sp. IS2]|nr:MAG: TIGR01620 family protein [Beggiatoa sp. IS2]
MNENSWKAPLFFELDQVEGIAEEESTVTLTYSPAIILPNELELKTDALLLAHEPEVAEVTVRYTAANTSAHTSPKISPIPPIKMYQNFSPLTGLVGSLSSLLICMLLLDAYYFVAEQYTHSFFLGTFFLGLIALIVASVLTLSWRAYQNLQTLRMITKLQQEGRKLMEVNGYGSAIHYINRVAHFYLHRPDVKARLDRFYVTLNDSHHDREICTLFSGQVMKELDQQAYRIVLQRSKETALLVVLSPIALLDTVLTLWRSVRMIRDIATLYGGRPGFLASTSLVISVVQNLVYAEVSEVLADGMAETLGHSVFAVLSAKAAQGVGSGVLTARVGLRAMTACRPLPFVEDEKPRLKEIRREIMLSLKGLIETKKSEGNRKKATT